MGSNRPPLLSTPGQVLLDRGGQWLPNCHLPPASLDVRSSVTWYFATFEGNTNESHRTCNLRSRKVQKAPEQGWKTPKLWATAASSHMPCGFLMRNAVSPSHSLHGMHWECGVSVRENGPSALLEWPEMCWGCSWGVYQILRSGNHW